MHSQSRPCEHTPAAHLMISDQVKCIYIHIPKTGGHTIDKYFLNLGLVSQSIWHGTCRDIIEMVGEETFNAYYRFTVVRNPWERWLSEYLWQGSAFSTQIPTPWGNKKISFADFCRSDFRWYPKKQIAQGHLADQAHFVYTPDDKCLVNDVIRFEEFQVGFASMCRKLKLPVVNLPRLNATTHGPYWEYYNDELAELIGKRFERDVRLFNYRFGM